MGGRPELAAGGPIGGLGVRPPEKNPAVVQLHPVDVCDSTACMPTLRRAEYARHEYPNGVYVCVACIPVPNTRDAIAIEDSHGCVRERDARC
jgi:hypothetical protein